MNKQLLFNEDARRKIQEGIDVVANAVKVTLGPKGRNVILDQEYGQPHITKDGVSVAKEIELKDKKENKEYTVNVQVPIKTSTSIYKYIIKLISEGAPIKYSATGTNGSDDITNFDKADNLNALSYGTYIIPKVLFEDYEKRPYKGIDSML